MTMKKIFLLLAVAATAVACNDMNDSMLSPDEVFSSEIEELIKSQNGKFNDDEFYAKLTSSVAIRTESIFYLHDGTTSLSGKIENNVPQTNEYLFFNDNTYWACFDPYFHIGAEYPDPPVVGAIRNEWNYDYESNEITVVWKERFHGNKLYEWVSKVVYFDGDTMILRGRFSLFDDAYKEVIKIFSLKDGREEYEKKYECNIDEYLGR